MSFGLRSFLTAFALIAAASSAAFAAPTRSEARYYTVLGWGSNTFKVTTSGGDTDVFGNMGIGASLTDVNLTDMSLKQTGFPNDADYPAHHGDFVIYQNISGFNGGDLHNSTMEGFAAVSTTVNTAVSDAIAIGTFWKNQAATVLNGGNLVTGALTVNGGGVYKIKGLSYSDASDVFTINASASDFVVINVCDDFHGDTFKMTNGGMALTGGITADHVLWNFLGDGVADNPDGTVEFTGERTLYGTFLGPEWEFKINGNSHLYGAIWFGAGITIVSNADIHEVASGLVPQINAVPLPPAAWTGLVLLAAMAGLHHVRRRRLATATI